MRLSRFALVANFAAILLALTLVWEPEVAAYWVTTQRVDKPAIDKARVSPADEVLEEVGRQRLGLRDKRATLSAHEATAARRRASALLSGKAQFSDEAAVDVSFPFDGSNLTTGSPSARLHMASMGTVDILLDGFRASGEPRYLDAAAQELLAFARVERRSLIPRGLLWNDHALANRMSVLAEMWLTIRQRPDLDAQLAPDLLDLASRTAARLAKPALFNYRTNHGVMQSLALLQYAVAFPTLPDADSQKAIGCERLIEQMRYYVSPEGAVLEHSAGYHEFGRDLLETGLRLSALTGCPAHKALKSELEKVRSVSALLSRPDGSLPVYGNTDSVRRIDATPGLPLKPSETTALLTTAGLAVWWTGLENWPREERLSQAVITWSAFPTRAHKHADEMSIVVWSRGQSWIGGTGYWPYSTHGYDAAQGWRSSNAPHFVGEGAKSERDMRLRGVAEGTRARAIDLERRVADGSRLRRRVIELDGSRWLIVDSVDSGSQAAVERLWTLPPEAALQPIGDSSFLLSVAPQTSARLSVVGELTASPALLRGSHDPFGGWIIRQGEPVAAPAIVVSQRPQRSLVISIFEVVADNDFRGRPLPALEPGAEEDRWQVSLQLDDGPASAQWSGQRLVLQFADGLIQGLEVATDAAPSEVSRRSITAAFESTSARYPRFREIVAYRYKVSLVALVLLLLQECAVLATRQVLAWTIPLLRLLAATAWIAFGLYASLWYLR